MDICKKKKSDGDEEGGKEEGRKWICTAIETTTRLIVSFLVGDQTLEECRRFLEDFVSKAENKPLFVSDELPHYAKGLKELFHTLVQPEQTGRRGRPRKAQKVVDDDLDYATVHKTREKGRVVKVEKRIVYGLEERIEKRLEKTPGNTINTSFVERSNLNWRVWDAHLIRKGLTFAKSLVWLKAKFTVCVAFYNFIRPHETLSRGKKQSLYSN